MRHGFRGSDLSKQCTSLLSITSQLAAAHILVCFAHVCAGTRFTLKVYVCAGTRFTSKVSRYKIYILACDSVALMVRPRFHDFFSRGLSPLRHYWPVRGMYRSIKYAVDWGNAHTDRVPSPIDFTPSVPYQFRTEDQTLLSGNGRRRRWQGTRAGSSRRS